jgi:MFS family permease
VLRRFSLYGFLKNQRYFEPFLILVFLDKGLSFFLIGLLVAFREITVNLLEVPSGAMADVWGRRRSLILSFGAYIVSFVIFGLSKNIPLLFGAMFLYGVGDAFRTGTHKAMIFAWLRNEGLEAGRTKVYGYTRSWSQFGSALSVIIASAVVLAVESYTWVFFLAIPPYIAGILNFLGYPAEVDGRAKEGKSFGEVASHLARTLSRAVRSRGIRRLVLESAGFEGVFKAGKDYLQPVLASTAVVVLAGPLFLTGLGGAQKAAVLVGPVYFALHLLSGLASRNAHRLVGRCGSEEKAARWIWGLNLLSFLLILPATYFEIHPLVILGFILVSILQNVWRPVLISRFDAQGGGEQAATVLSIESQAKSVSTMILAPALGLAVDTVKAGGLGGPFWPVGALGAAVALVFLVMSRSGGRQECGK